MDVVTLAMAKAYTDKKAGYSEMTEVVVLPEMTAAGGDTPVSFQTNIVEGETYIVKYDGVEYECEAKQGSTYHGVGFGDDNLYGWEEPTTGFPFLVCTDNWGSHVYAYDFDNSHTISVVQRKETIHPIDPKLIPVMDSITLNGADGKQYKVAVNASGVLTATAL